jgi:hypothetical protein
VTSTTLRNARVGDLLPSRLLGPREVRRLAAWVVVQPGTASLADYLGELESRAEDIADWDGRVVTAPPDGEADHRLVVADRYRQVYAVTDAPDAGGLPDAESVVEWFRFLATACPECGVLDDPMRSGPTP